MSAAARRKRHRRRALPPSAETRMAGWGRNLGNNLGAGYFTLFEPKPVGMEPRNVALISVGYAEGTALNTDGSMLVWGTNHSSVLPAAIGPNKAYCGLWEYRTGLRAQIHYETEAEKWSPATLLIKEQKKELPPYKAKEKTTGGTEHEYVANGRPIGQMVYKPGFTCLAGGKTWEALVENLGVEPGTDETVWVLAATQVNQFFSHKRERFEPFSENKAFPVLPSGRLTSGVIAHVWGGQKGLALYADGTVDAWGYVHLGGVGDGVDKSWGPKPRPEEPRPPFLYTFQGAIAAGASIITNTASIKKPKAIRAAKETGTEPAKVGKTGWLLEAIKSKPGKLGDPGVFLYNMAEYFTSPEEGVEYIEPVQEVQRVKITGAATSGSFKLGFEGQSTTAINFNATAAAVKTAIGTLTPATALAVAVTGGPGPGEPWTIEFLGTGPRWGVPQPLFTIESSTLVGGTASVERTVAGKAGQVVLTKPALKALPAETVYEIRESGGEASFWRYLTTENAGFPVKVETSETIVAIAGATSTGAYPFCLGLTNLGEVVSWGSHIYGQLGDTTATGQEKFAPSPAKVKEPGGANMKNIIAVACGETFGLALTEDRKVWCWGKVEEAQAGKTPLEGEKPLKTTPTPVLVAGLPTTLGERPKAIAGGGHTSYALLEDGTVMAWGGNEHGELGNGTISGKKTSTNKTPWNSTPTRIPGLTNIGYISAGRQHTGAMTTTGALYTWGGSEWGQIGDGTREKLGAADKGSPVKIFNSGVVSFGTGEFNTMAILEPSVTPAFTCHCRLVPMGEYNGEPRAKLKIRWHSTTVGGWKLQYAPKATGIEEAELENEKELYEEIVANETGEFSTTEIEEAEGELERLKGIETEREAGGATNPITPVSLGGNEWEYSWEPPSPMTPELGFVVRIQNNTAWKEQFGVEPTILTDYLWGSPFSYSEF